MPPLDLISRRDLIRYLRQLDFDGPYSGGRHQFMVRGDVTLWIPNPHQGDIGRDFLAHILRQGHVDRDEWEKL